MFFFALFHLPCYLFHLQPPPEQHREVRENEAPDELILLAFSIDNLIYRDKLKAHKVIIFNYNTWRAHRRVWESPRDCWAATKHTESEHEVESGVEEMIINQQFTAIYSQLT